MKRRASVSRRDLQGLLLDTSFLLPILGYRVSDRVMRVFERLKGVRLFYSELSILEALWKVSKMVAGLPAEERREAVERVSAGLQSIEAYMERVEVVPEAVRLALDMYARGHRDMVDNLLYASAVSHEIALLTVDEKLVRFVERAGLPRNNILLPEEL